MQPDEAQLSRPRSPEFASNILSCGRVHYSNTLLSVRRVTQQNAGRYTPGVDKVVVKTPQARGRLVDLLSTAQPWRVQPARRAYIPKATGKLRPLGISTILDRCLQARVKNALEPFWEARFEETSYGFRPGRGCHDALAKIYLLANSKGRKRWVVDADIKGCFDNVSHDYVLAAIGSFPARELIKQWLKAGYVDNGAFHETPTGTGQGSVISPLLANVALHGLEDALGVRRRKAGGITGPRAVVRYADVCRCPHTSAYAGCRVMPTPVGKRLMDPIASGARSA